MKELFEIFIASAKVGALTFGGGYAMLPILQREIVENKGWNSEAEILIIMRWRSAFRGF